MKSLGLTRYALAISAASAIAGGVRRIAANRANGVPATTRGCGHGSHDTMRRPWTSYFSEAWRSFWWP